MIYLWKLSGFGKMWYTKSNNWVTLNWIGKKGSNIFKIAKESRIQQSSEIAGSYLILVHHKEASAP